MTIENFINSFRISTDVERSLQYVFSLLFYLNYAVNWIIHVAIGSKFRRVLSAKFCCCNTAANYGNDTNTCESRQDTRNSMVSMQKYSRSSTASVRKYSRNSAVSMRKYSRNSTVSIRKCSRNSAVSIGKYSQGSLSRTRRHSSRSSGELHFAMTSNTLQTAHTENLMDTKSRLCVPQWKFMRLCFTFTTYDILLRCFTLAVTAKRKQYINTGNWHRCAGHVVFDISPYLSVLKNMSYLVRTRRIYKYQLIFCLLLLIFCFELTLIYRFIM